MEKIKDYIEKTFIGLPITYSGSYALEKQGMIDRKASDIDICFHKNYYELVWERIRDSKIDIITHQTKYPDRDSIIVISIDGIHMDIFFDRNFSFQKTVDIGGETLLHGYEILKKKLDLLMNNSRQPHKHKVDIVNSMLPDGKKNAKLTEKIKEEIPNNPTIEDLPF